MAVDKQHVIPAGSIVPPSQGDAVYNGPDEEDLKEEVAAPEETAEETPKLLGKFKNHDELTKAYSELEQKMSTQGSEVGNLRKQNEQLMQALQQFSARNGGQPGDQQPANDWDAQLGSIKKAVEEGEMDISEALAKTAEITASKAAGLFESKIQEYDKTKQAEQMQQQFLTKNPDFTELNGSGVLDQLMADNPLLDRISAYYAYKADVAAQEAQRKYEEGKNEGQKFASTADGQRKVLSKPGTSGRSAVTGRRNGPVSENELVSQQLAALQALRGAQAQQ